MHTQPSAFFSPSAAYRRRICHLLSCVLSKRVHPLHPPTLHPLSCCHPSWDNEQAGQLAFHMPTHSVREPDARATCHSARSRSPGLRQKRQGSALPPARVSAWQFCTPDSASTGCQIARCTSSARRWLLMADRAAIGPNATDAERACSPSSPWRAYKARGPRRVPLAICLCHAIAFESALIHPFCCCGESLPWFVAYAR